MPPRTGSMTTTSKTPGGVKRPTFTLSRRPKIVAAAVKQKTKASTPSPLANKTKLRNRNSSSSRMSLEDIPIPSFHEIHTDELEQLEKEFLEEDDIHVRPFQSKSRRTASLSLPAAVTKKLPSTLLELSDDDDALLAEPIFPTKTKQVQDTTVVAAHMDHCDNDVLDVLLDDDASTERTVPRVNTSTTSLDGLDASTTAASDNSPVADIVLVEAVHKHLESHNLETFTLRQLVQTLETDLGTSLSKAQRRRVKQVCESSMNPQESKDATEVTTNTCPDKMRQQPAKVELFEAVDRVFGQGGFDIHTGTIKPVITAVQAEFGGLVFTKTTRGYVKERLAEWVHTRMQEDTAKAATLPHLTPAAPCAIAPAAAAAPPPRLSPASPPHPLYEQENDSQASNHAMNSEVSKLPGKFLDTVNSKPPAPAIASGKDTELLLPKPLPEIMSTAPETALVMTESDNVHPKPPPLPVALLRGVKDVIDLEDTPEKPKQSRRGRPRKSIDPADGPSSKPKARTRAVTTATVAGVAPVTRKRARAAPRGGCQLCRNCPCIETSANTGSSLIDSVLGSMAKTDAGVERALIKRLEKLERVTEGYEDQTDAVRRKLRKHRRDMFLKWEAKQNGPLSSSTLRSESRFLPDSDEWHGGGAKKKLSTSAVTKAQGRLFDFAPSYQPTLTQMFGTSKKTTNDATSDERNDDIEQVDGEGGSVGIIGETEPVLPDNDCTCKGQGPLVLQELSEGGEEEAFVAKSEPVPAHRIDWKDGVEQEGETTTAATSGTSIWGSLLSGHFSSAWDRLFEDPAEVENLGVDHLVGLFSPTQDTGGVAPPTFQQVDIDVLSQRAQGLAATLIERVESDEEKVIALELACPNWKENVVFAMHQQDQENVDEALKSVEASRAKLQRVRAEMLKLLEQQEAAMDVLEDALRQSHGRLAPMAEPENEGFFMSQMPPTSGSPGRPSFQSEVATLVPSGSLLEELASDSDESIVSCESIPSSPS